MHSFGYRANALLTLAIIMCAMASFSDNFNSPSPSASVEVSEALQRKRRGQLDTKYFSRLAVALYLEHEAGVSWDGIIPSQEHAQFWIRTTNKYRFMDQGNNLRGKEFYLTMHWHVMPKTGKMSADKIIMSGYRLPDEYR